MEMEGLTHCSANYEPLSPISFLERAASIYGDKPSVIYGSLRFSWSQTHERCLKLASSLSKLQISRGDIVAALAPNIPALYELHFAVPMAGAVLCALNTRSSAALLSQILQQLEAKIIFVDHQFVDLVLESLTALSWKPVLVLISELDQEPSSILQETPPGCLNYNALLESGEADFDPLRPTNESDPISVSFTSGSTGNPKGVVYSHRATYLNSLAGINRSGMKESASPVFLWTVDMFRCNGWCFTWAMAALGGTNICLREVSARAIFDALFFHSVTHFFGAPTILKLIADAPPGDQRPLRSRVDITVAGVLPNPQVVERVQEMGFNVSDGYGMTEALGPAIVRPYRPESKTEPEPESEHAKSLSGLHNIVRVEVDVKDPETMKSMPQDGRTIGEVMLRGNTLMLGYLKNPKATQEAFRGGWYRTGDLGVRHQDGYIQMKDRRKDIIFSGGEPISTLEIESVLIGHPKVLEAAVVGKQDNSLGQVPCAFVKMKEGSGACASAEEVIEFCGDHLKDSMVPRGVVFGDLPVNSTGKVQKFVLREKVNGLN